MTDRFHDAVRDTKKAFSDRISDIQTFQKTLQEKQAEKHAKQTTRVMVERHTLRWMAVRISLAVIGVILSYAALPMGALRVLVCIVCCGLCGYSILLDWVQELLGGKPVSRNLLWLVCTAATIAIGKSAQAVWLSVGFLAGDVLSRYLEQRLMLRAYRDMDGRPTTMTLLVGEMEHTVDSCRISEGDTLRMKVGDRAAVDGVVERGSGMLDTAYVDGSPNEHSVHPGDRIRSGAFLTEGEIILRASGTSEQSFAAVKRHLAEKYSGYEPWKMPKLAALCRLHTPFFIVLSILIGVFVPLLFHRPFSEYLPKGITLLLLGSTWLYTLPRELIQFAGICGGLHRGGLVPGGKALHLLAGVTTVAGDSDTAFCSGKYAISQLLRTDNVTEMEARSFFRLAASESTYPVLQRLAVALDKVTPVYENKFVRKADIPGIGILLQMEDGQIEAAGNENLLKKWEITPPFSAPKDAIYWVRDGKCIAAVVLKPILRQDAPELRDALANVGVSRLVMVTGEKREEAVRLAEKLHIQEFYSDCSGEEKVQKISDLRSMQLSGEHLCYLGDGVSDEKQLEEADLGAQFARTQEDVRTGNRILLYRNEVSCLPELIACALATEKSQKDTAILGGICCGALTLLTLLVGLSGWLAVVIEAAAGCVELLMAMQGYDAKRYQPKNLGRAAKKAGILFSQSVSAAEARQKAAMRNMAKKS